MSRTGKPPPGSPRPRIRRRSWTTTGRSTKRNRFEPRRTRRSPFPKAPLAGPFLCGTGGFAEGSGRFLGTDLFSWGATCRRAREAENKSVPFLRVFWGRGLAFRLIRLALIHDREVSVL